MNLKILRPKLIFSAIFAINLLTIVALTLELTVGVVSLSEENLSGITFPTTFKCLLYSHSLLLGAQMIAVFCLGVANRKKFPHLLSIYLSIAGFFHFILGPGVIAYCLVTWHITEPVKIQVYYDFPASVFTMLVFETIFAAWAFYVILVAYREFIDNAVYKELTEPLTANAV